jgi:surface protein
MQLAASALLLLLLLLDPSAIAQPTPITDGNIKLAVSDWTASPTTATTRYGNIGGWNVAAVTSMGGLFLTNPAFNQNLAAWNVASVGNMHSMFQQATAFNQNLAAWNTAKVTNMAATFTHATVFNQNLAGWNVASVTSMTYMFSSAAAFNQNLAGWNVRGVFGMFMGLSGASPPTVPPALLLPSHAAESATSRVSASSVTRSNVRIRHVSPTEWSLEWQASSMSPSA